MHARRRLPHRSPFPAPARPSRYCRAMSSSAAPFTAFGIGLAAGVVVTRRSHRAPSSPGWALPVGGTRLRRSDLPVGGTLALMIAGLLHKTGREGPARVVAALGAGAAVGAVGTGLLEPLPRR